MPPLLHPIRVRLLLWAALTCCLALSGCRSPEEQFAEHVSRAEGFVAERRVDEAILEYRGALNIDASSAEINHRIADLMSLQGATGTAAHFFLEAYRLDPSRIDAAMRYVVIVAGTDRNRANTLLAEALERASDRAIVHRTVAILALMDEDMDGALESVGRAIELDAEDSENWIQLGRVHRKRVAMAKESQAPIPDSLYEEGIAAFDRADEILGGDVPARLERAEILAAWKPRSAEVRRAYEDTLEFAAKNENRDEQAAAANALAAYAGAVGDPELQARALRAFVAIYPDTIVHWKGLVEIEGEPVFAGLLAARPKDARAHRLWINYLLENDRGEEATSHLEAVLSGGLESPGLWDDLIRLRLQRAQITQALSHLEQLEKQSPDHPVTRRARARVAMATRENREAVMLLRSIPAEAVGAEDRRLLALAEYRMGDFEAAKRSIAQAIAMSSEVSYPALHLKARIHHDAEEWLLAFNTFKQIMDAEVELSAEEQLMAARTLYERRRRAAGKAMLLILLAGDDTPPHAAVEYAQREGSDDPLGAMLHLVAAQKRAPENFALLQEMTLIDRRRGAKNTGLNQALKRVDSAVERGEGGIRTLLLRAEILADLGELERAENDALRAFEAAPSMPGAVDLLVQIYRKQDKIAEARKSFEEAEQAGVLHAGARRLLARLYAEQGDHADALRVLEEVLEESPDMVGATRDLARILASEGSDPERALESARSANDRQKHNPRSAATLAFVYFRSEFYEDALREYQRSLRLDRTSGRRMTPSLLYNLGLTLQKLDQNEKAARAFESALAISDDFPEAVEARRQLYKTSS